MKKWKIVFIVVINILIISGLFISFNTKKPFKDLEAKNITAITVHFAFPNNKTIAIKDIETFVNHFKNITVIHKDNSYTEYKGETITFTITKTDDKQIEVMVFSSFIVIDGVGYRYPYCQKLIDYAYQLLKTDSI